MNRRPLHLIDENPRKRRKLSSSWDVPPSQLQAQPILVSSGEDVGNGNGEGVESSISSNHIQLSPSTMEFKARSSRNGSPRWRNDDKDGHYVFEFGENLTPRYKILSKMGKGTFGQVLECWDRKSKDLVAIKIVRGLQKYREAATVEIDVLCEVAKYDKTGTRCVQLRDWFEYRNHTCIVFEKLGPSLYDVLRKNDYRPFPVDLVKEVGRQLLESVAYMHELKFIHTDLKTENVLFVSSDIVKIPDKGLKRSSQEIYNRLPKSSAIKLIDFGSTTFELENHTSLISTRHYRAPEVILGLRWSYPCDIWSIGCILVELCLGETLFQTHENLEHLAMMERVLGPLPQHMIKKADRYSAKYFRHGKTLDWPEGASSKESIRSVRKLFPLRNLIMEHVDHSAGLLIDLLQGLLKFEPSQRLKASEALSHPFFTGDFIEFA